MKTNNQKKSKKDKVRGRGTNIGKSMIKKKNKPKAAIQKQAVSNSNLLNKKRKKLEKNPKPSSNNNSSQNQRNVSSQTELKKSLEDVQKPIVITQDKQQKKQEKLRQGLELALMSNNTKKAPEKQMDLRQRMMQKLKAARFRSINERMYKSDSKKAMKLFEEDKDAFEAYHEGYSQQVRKWPLNPVDLIIKAVHLMPQSSVIADFGCGNAKLAQSVTQKVHSFDLVSTNEHVTACDMSKVPLASNSADLVVFCLSLMGTNLGDYLCEANRVLKTGGVLKIAEVESRFENVQKFIEGMKRFHFKNTAKDLSHNLFYFLDFKKVTDLKQNQRNKLRNVVKLSPCLYKKR